jgi:hypothetical protein
MIWEENTDVIHYALVPFPADQADFRRPRHHAGPTSGTSLCFFRREPSQWGTISPRALSIAIISYWGKPKTISESVKSKSPKIVLPIWD